MDHNCIFLEGFSETTKNSGTIVDIPAEIRTQHLPNKSLELYRYTNLLGESISGDEQKEE
jgi:hypothetical protein